MFYDYPPPPFPLFMGSDLLASEDANNGEAVLRIQYSFHNCYV